MAIINSEVETLIHTRSVQQEVNTHERERKFVCKTNE